MSFFHRLASGRLCFVYLIILALVLLRHLVYHCNEGTLKDFIVAGTCGFFMPLAFVILEQNFSVSGLIKFRAFLFFLIWAEYLMVYTAII